MAVLEQLYNERFFYFFEELTRIPRGSGNTREVSEYVCSFAEKNGLSYRKDEKGNVLVIKEAAPGYEESSTVMLQGHLDMVCEKNMTSQHNFMTDPLPLAIMDDYIYSKNTSLGADDGIAAAYMLAILEDKELLSPRLECLFTVDEEIGMLGADFFDASDCRAEYLLNIDSEDEGIFTGSCAGGARVNASVPVRLKEKSGIRYNLVVSGFRGGHSGTEIDKYYGNANIILGRLLHHLTLHVKFSIISLQGGLQDNAICREANAEILVEEKDCSNFEDFIDEFEGIIRNEYRATEKNIQIYCDEQGTDSCQALTHKTQERIIFLLNTIPDGVQKMSMEIPGLVQTSLNLGIMRLKGDSFTVTSAIRSSIESERDALADKIKYLSLTIGGSFEKQGIYPAWEYREDSRLRNLILEKYKELTGKEGVACGIHAGLECGILSKKLPKADIISYGPDICDIHTPKEKLSISSSRRVYELTLEVLKSLK